MCTRNLISAIGLLAVCTQGMAQTPADLVSIRESLAKALDAHDLDQVLSYVTDDVVFDLVPFPPPLKGKAQVRALFEGEFAAFPDWHTTEGRVLAVGNMVVVEHAIIGTHLGTWNGFPPTGNTFQLPHIDIYEFEGDKVKRCTTYADMAGEMMQLGLMPAPDLDPALLVPSFPLPNAEPTGLALLEAEAEGQSRWNSHDLSSCAKVVHPDAEVFIAALGLTLDRGGYIASQELYFLGFPDGRMEAIRSVDMGDGWLLNEVVWKGTNLGPYFGIPATRCPIELRGAYLSRWNAEGLQTNLQIYFDNLTVLAQLGVFPPPDPQANKALDRRSYEEVWNQGNLDVIDELIAPDFVLHDPGLPEDMIGPDGFRQFAILYRTAFPDIHFTVEDQIAEGEMVATRWTATGTHSGELMGPTLIPPTGNQVVGTGITFVRVSGGKYTELWNSWDALGMMQQVGVVPPTRADYTWGAPSGVIGDPGDPAANTALVLYLNQKFWNEKNADVLDRTHRTDSIAHNPVTPGHPLPFYVYKQVGLIHIAAFPDLRVTTDHIIAEGDKVAVRWTVTGTHEAELMGIPASGKKATWTGITIYRFADDKIVESWWAYDAMGMIQQITGP